MTEQGDGDSTPNNDTPAGVSTPPISLPGISIRPSAHERRSVPSSLNERYDEIAFLGEGGMGTVYRARDKRLGRLVAIKVLKGLDAKLGERFLLEARSQAKIQHDHVCRVYEAGEAEGEPFIVMQYIDGEPLSKMASRLTIEQRVKVMREISSAVHEAHRLGLIHRDIKPSNILVETLPDGLKPYIMDFGLAKEVADQGQTMSGAVLGTPAYMSPEQARGELKLMDRRSDVYSLGATLYDILAGQAPFVAPHTWKLIMMVAYEDVPALSTVKKGLPGDLETIVMKCLERDTSRRYDSARALGDDLQRFLDAEPILGRRASLGYVLWKKARKHKFVTALGSIALVSALSLGGLWVKARRDAAVQASIGQEFGENVKEMELFLRAAYALPLHDVEVERDVVRRKLATIEMRMREVGKLADGPGHYALGRGNLVLGDPTKAREHLEKAVTAGYRSPALEIALGQTLGELYRRALEETKRISNKAEREKREAELASSLRDPALVHLRAATGTEIESPAYVEGLIALYEGKNEEARTKAQKAFELAPWMYEAKKLEADALFAEGSKYRHDAAFDWEKMMLSFGPAAEAYKVAARMGESDPEVYRAECELWEKTGHAEHAKGRPWVDAYAHAVTACSHGVQSSSRDVRTRVQRAQMAGSRYFMATQTNQGADDAERDALTATEEALAVAPQNVSAWYARASTLSTRASSRNAKTGDGSFDEAITAFLRALDIDPQFCWALNEVAQAYLYQANAARLRGMDPREKVQQAIKHIDRAFEVDSTFTLPTYARIRAATYRLEYEMDHGADARETLTDMAKAAARIDEQNMTGWLAAFWKAKSLRLRAAYQRSTGLDPMPELTAAKAVLQPFVESDQSSAFTLRELGEVQWLEAQHAFDKRVHDEKTLDAVIATIKRLRPNGWNLDSALLGGKTELLAANMVMVAKRDPAASFEAAIAYVEPELVNAGNEPRGYQMMAEIRAARAVWLDEQGKNPVDDIAIGLKMVDKVLAINPHHAMAYAMRGVYWMLRAARAVDGEKTRHARAAIEAFDLAFRENPRLRERYGEQAKRVAGW